MKIKNKKNLIETYLVIIPKKKKKNNIIIF